MTIKANSALVVLNLPCFEMCVAAIEGEACLLGPIGCIAGIFACRLACDPEMVPFLNRI